MQYGSSSKAMPTGIFVKMLLIGLKNFNLKTILCWLQVIKLANVVVVIAICHKLWLGPSNKMALASSLDGIWLDILFSSNHNIHKSSSGHCFWALDPLIDGF